MERLTVVFKPSKKVAGNQGHPFQINFMELPFLLLAGFEMSEQLTRVEL